MISCRILTGHKGAFPRSGEPPPTARKNLPLFRHYPNTENKSGDLFPGCNDIIIIRVTAHPDSDRIVGTVEDIITEEAVVVFEHSEQLLPGIIS
jgi:hypothetical protein